MPTGVADEHALLFTGLCEVRSATAVGQPNQLLLCYFMLPAWLAA